MAKERAVVVGAGGISRRWFDVLNREKVNVEAVVDLRVEAAKERIEQFELDAEASADLKAMLKKYEPDFVLDVTVPEAHCNVTCTALKAGCHVIGEKPMAAGMAEARRMVKASEEAGKLYMVSQSRRYDSKHDRIRKAIAAGKLGKVSVVNCDFYINPRFGGFRAEMPSPLILDMSIHHFDLMRMFTGADPVAVYAHEFNPPGSWAKGGDVAASCIFEMADGLVFSYNGHWAADGCSTSWHGDWRFVGEKGTIVYQRDQEPEGEVISRQAGRKVTMKKLAIPKSTLKAEAFGGALKEMLAFLRKGATPQGECHDNIKSLAMVFAAMDSARKGRRVAIKA